MLDTTQFIYKFRNKTIFMGDSLQRIYGFIGAIPNILEISINGFNMHKNITKTKL